MFRYLMVFSGALWLIAMGALFHKDVWPSWTAQDAPRIQNSTVARLGRQQQYAILANGNRIGKAWSDFQTTSQLTAINGTILIDGITSQRPIRIETITEFDANGDLDSFDLKVFGVLLPGMRHGRGMMIFVRGDRRGIYFPCEMRFGAIRREVNLDLTATRMVGDSIRPVSYLPDLKVGQSWRMQVLDPLAIILTGKTRFKSIIARVAGTETLTRGTNKQVRCFIVETTPEKTKAYVDETGHVLAQEVELPGLGLIQMNEEEYTPKLREQARQRIRAWSEDN